MKSDTTTHGDEIKFGKSQNENQEERNLPPLAESDGVRIWFSRESDKNGDYYAVIEQPGHQPIRVFFKDAAKPTMNNFVEQWRERRKEQNGGGQ